jgi:ferredoxin
LQLLELPTKKKTNIMFGNKRHNQKGQHQSGSSAGVCACPSCGYSIPHVSGIPCRTHLCPTCMVLLVRGESSNESSLNIKEKQANPEQVIPTLDLPTTPVFPIVDADLCIGCEACIESCPANAILMDDGKAVIQNERCKNCRKCVGVCPVWAIS